MHVTVQWYVGAAVLQSCVVVWVMQEMHTRSACDLMCQACCTKVQQHYWLFYRTPWATSGSTASPSGCSSSQGCLSLTARTTGRLPSTR
jgi:hypothetical protein